MTPSNPLAVHVVDDNRDAADSLAAILKSQRHDVRTASSAADVGRVVGTGFRPGVVLMDIGLPGTDGYAVARELCDALGERPLLIAVTGHQHLDDRSDREGFDLHFLKPVDPALLVEVLTVYAQRGGSVGAAGT